MFRMFKIVNLTHKVSQKGLSLRKRGLNQRIIAQKLTGPETGKIEVEFVLNFLYLVITITCTQ